MFQTNPIVIPFRSYNACTRWTLKIQAASKSSNNRESAACERHDST
jgi:hypothetical protein